MTNQIEKPNNRKYDLEERTAIFGEEIIKFVKILPDIPINRPLINQIIRSGTSIGANYMEANGAESKKDFQHKIRMIATANTDKAEKCRKLWKEVHELVLIFSSIVKKTK